MLTDRDPEPCPAVIMHEHADIRRNFKGRKKERNREVFGTNEECIGIKEVFPRRTRNAQISTQMPAAYRI